MIVRTRDDSDETEINRENSSIYANSGIFDNTDSMCAGG